MELALSRLLLLNGDRMEQRTCWAPQGADHFLTSRAKIVSYLSLLRFLDIHYGNKWKKAEAGAKINIAYLDGIVIK